MDVIRAAVIGTGFIGPAHVEALRRLAVCRRDSFPPNPVCGTIAAI